MTVKIKEQTWYARLAAYKLKSNSVAIVYGHTIHLWNVSRGDFLRQTPWVVHELEHVRQFQRYGFLRFGFLYLVECARKGYYNNRFEVEARAAEISEQTLSDIKFL